MAARLPRVFDRRPRACWRSLRSILPVLCPIVVIGAVALFAFTAPAAEPSKKPAQPDPAKAGAKPKSPPAKPAAAAAKPGTRRPIPHPVAADPNTLTDENIGTSIRRGADWLYGRFNHKTYFVPHDKEQGHKEDKEDGRAESDDGSHAGGVQALAVYALMQCGVTLRDDSRFDIKGPEMRNMLDALMKYNLDKDNAQTYAHGLRATALAFAYDHLPNSGNYADYKNKVILPKIKQDVEYGLRACDGGAYTYVMRRDAAPDLASVLAYYDSLKQLPKPQGNWDNSNCQYGLLGVWSAAECQAGVSIPPPYWYLVDKHWSNSQLPDGQWPYNPRANDGEPLKGKLSMTAAGLATLLVTYDYIVPPNLSGQVGREPFSKAVKKGLAWFEKGDNAIQGAARQGYTLYGVERVGLASGLKFFGPHDWYKELAADTVKFQSKDGSFNGNVVQTAYHLLFLSRGRHPLLMNKLRFDGFWSNRPRDVSNLAKYVGRNIERELNWQVVSLPDTNWTAWLDAPLLYLASHQPPKVEAKDLDKIRNYVEAGGILFTQADGDSPEFNKFAEKLARDVFNQELVDVPANHPLFTAETVYNIKPTLPLKMVTNGSRVLMVHSPRDISRWWQQRDEVKHKAEFQFGVNLFVYAAGKRDFRNRIDSTYIGAYKPPAKTPKGTAPYAPPVVSIARLQYPGNWDPEPGAWRRYANVFERENSYKLEVSPVKIDDLKPSQTPLAVLTGTARQNWSPAQIDAVKAYVEAGGVLLVDMCGGNGKFDGSVTDLLKAAFPGKQPTLVPADHPLLSAASPGMQALGKRKLRAGAIGAVNRSGAQLLMVDAGKGQVVFSPIDFTGGLLGTDTAGIIGYEQSYAQSIVKNAIFWTLDGHPNEPGVIWTAPGKPMR